MTDPSPLFLPPAEEIRQTFREVATPSIVYDLDGIDRTVRILREDMRPVEGARLNLALKATHTPEVLAHFASIGLGADVASVGEYDLARQAGFEMITATGPSFTADDFGRLGADGVHIDASSIDQLVAFVDDRAGVDVGLRVRVPLPKSIDDRYTTFGSLSRFGVDPTDEALHRVLSNSAARVRRLHTHTGQMTPTHLIYKTRYLLAIARHYPDVDSIDLGGGFFSLYIDRAAAVRAWEEVGRDVARFRAETGRPITVIAEPGGALLAAHGYLVTTVCAVEARHPGFGSAVVGVDSSAWNVAPWHQPRVVPLTDQDGDESVAPTMIAGNTLYENDFFGTDTRGKRRSFPLPPLTAGDRLVFTASGAYTMTNARVFNRIPLPSQYVWRQRDGHAAL